MDSIVIAISDDSSVRIRGAMVNFQLSSILPVGEDDDSILPVYVIGVEQ
jgi:hypothetical protein